jgi:hypothetical protein
MALSAKWMQTPRRGSFQTKPSSTHGSANTERGPPAVVPVMCASVTFASGVLILKTKVARRTFVRSDAVF